MIERRAFPRQILLVSALAVVSAPATAIAQAVQHVVLLRLGGDAPAPTIRGIVDGFEQQSARIPGVIGFQWGTDNSPEGLQKGFTHGLVVTFEDAASRDAYLRHPAHRAFLTKLSPLLDSGAFAFDIDVEMPQPPLEPGQVRHLVFFKYKAESSAEEIARLNDAFAALPRRIPGLIDYQAGTNTHPQIELARGFTHGYLLGFVHADARDDYLAHPVHEAFGELVGPHLEEALVVDFTTRPSGGGLLVTDGLEPFKVFQRDEDGVAALEFSGLAAGAGPIEARLLSGRRVVRGFDWKKVGEARAGTFSAKLPGVPTGGEYTVEIRRRDDLGTVAEITEIANVIVGDIWILAGQSNMEGFGVLEDVEVPHPLVHCFTMAHRWELALEPLHWRIDSPDRVHYGDALDGLDEAGRRKKRAELRRQRRTGAGLGLPFAKEMVARTGVPVGLIASAQSGTSMTQWNPALSRKGGRSLYGSMLKQVRRAGGRVKGVLWYQGESDGISKAAHAYSGRFKGLVDAFRSDLGDPALPFYYVQIGRFVITYPEAEWKSVQEQQRLLAREIPHTAVVSAMDLPLDDISHVSTSGLKRLGARLSKVARRELYGEERLRLGPRLHGIEVSGSGTLIRVRFAEVNGRLHPTHGVAGFSLRQADGEALPLIFDASVDADNPDTVILKLRPQLPGGTTLWYGAGLNPYCNLVDSEDLAVLAFGPVAIEE